MEVIACNYSRFARNHINFGLDKTKLMMLDVNSNELSNYTDCKEHFYPSRPVLTTLSITLVFSILGPNEISFRLLLIAISIANIFLFHMFAARLFDKKRADMATLLFALNPMFLFYTITNPELSLSLFFVLLCFIFYLKEKYFISAIFIFIGCMSDWLSYFAVPCLILHLIITKKYVNISYYIVAVILAFSIHIVHLIVVDPGNVLLNRLIQRAQGSAEGTLSVFQYVIEEGKKVVLYFTVPVVLLSLFYLVQIPKNSFVLCLSLFVLFQIVFKSQAQAHNFYTYMLLPFFILCAVEALNFIRLKSKVVFYLVFLVFIAQTIGVSYFRFTRVEGQKLYYDLSGIIRETAAKNDRFIIVTSQNAVHHLSFYCPNHTLIYFEPTEMLMYGISLNYKEGIDGNKLIEFAKQNNYRIVLATDESAKDMDYIKIIGLTPDKIKEYRFQTKDSKLLKLLSEPYLRHKGWLFYKV